MRRIRSIQAGSILEIALYSLLLLSGWSILGNLATFDIWGPIFEEAVFICPMVLLPVAGWVLVPTLILIFLGMLMGPKVIRFRLGLWFVIVAVVIASELLRQDLHSGWARQVERTVIILYGTYLIVLSILPVYWVIGALGARKNLVQGKQAESRHPD